MDSLAEDTHFFGDWGGPMFDKHNYRPLYGSGGGICFDLSRIEPLIGTISLFSEADQELTVSINGTLVKKVSILHRKRSRITFLISPQRLLAKGNRLQIQKSLSHAPLKIETIRLISKKLHNHEPEPDQLALPAVLRCSVLAQEGEKLEISSRRKLDMRVVISRDSGPILQQAHHGMSKTTVDLPAGDKSPLWIDIECRSEERVVPMPELRLISPKEDLRNEAVGGVARHLAESGKSWNILVFLMDSARSDRLGTYGYPRPTSPNIDRLASAALIYSRFSSEAAYTLASTATLMTGLAPDSHNALSDYYGGLNGKLVTLAETYSLKGYFCAAVSAIPYCGRSFAMDQGFADFTELFQQDSQVKAQTFIPELDRLLERSRQETKPFFIYLHIREPHIDYLMPPPYYKSFRRTYLDLPDREFPKFIKDLYFGKGEWTRRPLQENELLLLSDSYDENLLSADAAIGEMLHSLERHQVKDQTIVIILGDHGEGLGEHKMIGHNVVLYREGVSIPLIVHIPGITTRSVVNGLPFSTSDLSHTLKSLITDQKGTLADSGIFAPRGRRFTVTRTIFFNRFYPHFVVEEGAYRAHMMFPFSRGGHLVFNIDQDPQEKVPIENEDLLNHFAFQIRQHLRTSLRTRTVATKSSTTEAERKTLESLGYL